MKTVFADTSYYLALLNPDDEYAEAAREYTGAFGGHQLTTAWVLTEVANSLSDVRDRRHLAPPPPSAYVRHHRDRQSFAI